MQAKPQKKKQICGPRGKNVQMEGADHMRMVEDWERRPENLNILDQTTDEFIGMTANQKFYGKFRAYLFTNFWIIGAGLLVCVIRCVLTGEWEAVAGFLGMAAIPIGLCWLLWRGVARRTEKKERSFVFWGFVSHGLAVLFKVMMYASILLLPLVNQINTIERYSYREITEGRYRGEWVLTRYKMNGQLVDLYGNVYEA